jgi:hypothetical protein
VAAIRCADLRRRMAARLDPDRWRHRPDAAVTRAIVEEPMSSLHGYGAGVVRPGVQGFLLGRSRAAGYSNKLTYS